MRRHPPKFDLERALQLRRDGVSIRKSARILDVNYNVISHYFRSRGLRTTREHLTWARWHKKFGEENFNKMVISGKSYRTVAAELMICPESLKKYIKHSGLKVDTGRLKQGVFSQRNYDPTINASIARMYKQGFTRWKICEAMGMTNDQVRNRLKAQGLFVGKRERFSLLFPSAGDLWEKGRQFKSVAHFCRHYGFSYGFMVSECARRSYRIPRFRGKREKEIPTEEAIRLYKKHYGLAFIASHLNVDRNALSRAIRALGVKTYRIKPNAKKPGYRPTVEEKRITMLKRFKFPLNVEKMTDFYRLRFLLRQLSVMRRRYKFSRTFPQKFLEKFYWDFGFNAVYDLWIASGKAEESLPSVDHIIPLYRGGTYKLQNLQFMTWFENRLKRSKTMDEWESFCDATGTRSRWFLRELRSSVPPVDLVAPTTD